MPDAMRQDLQPSIDFEQWWLRSARVVDRINRGVTVAPGVVVAYQDFSPNIIAVPENEWWFVHSLSVSGAIADPADVVNAVRLAMAWNAVGLIRYRFIGDQGPSTLMSATTPYLTLLAENFWAPPGSRIGFFVGSITGAGGLEMLVRGFDYTACPV